MILIALLKEQYATNMITHVCKSHQQHRLARALVEKYPHQNSLVEPFQKFLIKALSPPLIRFPNRGGWGQVSATSVEKANFNECLFVKSLDNSGSFYYIEN